MIFYKLLCIPPNLEIFFTGVYTVWCLCSREILSVHHLVDKIIVCRSTDGSDKNFIVTFIRYSVASLHIFQFIFAYVMLAAEFLTIYPILFSKSPALLNPVIMASMFRQVYSNSVAVILGALLCYVSGSDFNEFQCFVGRFLINMIVSYYIIFSYKDFRSYIQMRSSFVEGARVKEIVSEKILERKTSCFLPKYSFKAPAIRETKSENSFNSDRSHGFRKKVKMNDSKDDSINRMNSIPTRLKWVPTSEWDMKENVDSMPSTSSMSATSTDGNSVETFLINLVSRQTKENLLSFRITKQN